MGLRNSDREIDAETLLSYELSPIPASMFGEYGHMRTGKTKSKLKNDLKVEVSGRNIENSL